MRRLIGVLLLLWPAWQGLAESVTRTPFAGITYIHRTEPEHTGTQPRPVTMNVVLIDLRTPGLRVAVTAPSGSRETVRQRTVDFLTELHAQVAINAHFFLPYPSSDPEAFLVGLAVSAGRVYSPFEAPSQPYAIVSDAPALNIDRENRAAIVTRSPDDPEGVTVREPVELWNAVAGSAQVVTAGVKTIPVYLDEAHREGARRGALVPGGPGSYSNRDSWYERVNARTLIGLTRDRRTLVLFTVDRGGGSLGMTVGEAADVLIRDYGVWDALNLDGGGSTTLAMEDPETGVGMVANVPAEGPGGRAVGSNLGVIVDER